MSDFWIPAFAGMTVGIGGCLLAVLHWLRVDFVAEGCI